MNDLERVRDNADGQELLAVVTTFHHQATIRGEWVHSLRRRINGERTCRPIAQQWASGPS